jgi:hypothetical protein
MMVTVEPQQVAPAALALVDTVITIGKAPAETLQQLSAALGREAPSVSTDGFEQGQALVWSIRGGGAPVWMQAIPPRAERHRHARKYAEGELELDRNFYFRGPEGKLNLRAQNLLVFVQLAEGVDEETWLYHLREGDYAQWFREVIKDSELADETARIAERKKISAEESRALIKAAIEKRYTAPA